MAGTLEDMGPVVIWIVVALTAAAVVVVLAGVSGERSTTVRQFVGDLRTGLRRDRRMGSEGVLASARRELAEAAEVESSSVDELFLVGTPQDSAYVDAEELGGTLARVKDKAMSGVSRLTRR
jgi:hypothetical protein